MTNHRRPPRLARWFVERVASGSQFGNAALGDLEEEWIARAAAGDARADSWYRREAASLALACLRLRLTRQLPAAQDGSPMRSSLLANLRQDLHYALRSLRTNAGFSLVAVITFAIGIGATTAIFSVVSATLLRPLPFRDPGRLMSVFLRMPVQYGTGEIDMTWSYPKYQALVRAQRVFSETAPHLATVFGVSAEDGAESVRGEAVGARYFDILGVTPRAGRFFTESEDRPTGGDHSVVISDAFWHERFAAAPAVIGSTLSIAGTPYTIIGVAPAGFLGLAGDARLWTLYTATMPLSTLQSAGAHNFEVIARLLPGVTPAAAQQAVATIGRTIDGLYPDTDGHWRATAYSLNSLRVDPLVGQSVIVLAAAATLLLLIACVNIAGLLLARGASRRTELAVRLAIGAGRGRLVEQLVVESVVLAGVGVLVGVAVAFGAVHILGAMAPNATSNSSVRGTLTSTVVRGFTVDGRAITFSIIVSLLAGVGAGLAPAIAASRISLADAMRQGASTMRGGVGARRLGSRGLLVIGEIALASILLVGSALMARSLARLFAANLGFHPEHLIAARVALDPARASHEPVGQLWREIQQRLAAIPGVTGVGTSSCAPIGDHCEGTSLDLPGRTEPSHVSYIVVSPGYFAAIGTPILRGRDIAATDIDSSESVMLINQAAARQLWGTLDPLTTPVGHGKPMRVVGVVGDVRYENVEAPAQPTVFVSNVQSGRRNAYVVVRTANDPSSAATAIVREIRAIDRNHAVSDVKTLRERMYDTTARNRFAATLLSVFAAVALGLAALGIYGVLSLAVTQRRRELGIRVALGAARWRLLRMVMGDALILVAFGALIGGVGAVAGGRAIRSLLYGITALDPVAYVACAVVLIAAACAAAAIPALRATRVHPASVLRGE